MCTSATTTQSPLTAVISDEDDEEEEKDAEEDSSDLCKLSDWDKIGSLSEISSLWLSLDTNCIAKIIKSKCEIHAAKAIVPTDNINKS